MEKYDCTNDVKEHIGRVAFWIDWLAWGVLKERAKVHDASKLLPPEKEIFDEYTPKLKEFRFGSNEYRQAVAGMGKGLKHHYENNRHHPEHFENGIDGMCIWDLVEMLADWMAACSVKDDHMDIDYLQEHFNLSPQLRSIIENTLREADFDDATLHIPPQFQSIKTFMK